MEERFERLWRATRGLVFDFDGLLVDSEPFHFRAYDEVFREFGHALDPEEYWVEFTSKGKGARGEIERHGLAIDPRDIDRRKPRIFGAYCREGLIPFQPGARELLEAARDTGRPMILASASRERDIRAVLEGLGATGFFPRIVGRERAPDPKPDPGVFLAAARDLGLEPRACLVFEDAEKGVRAAHAAGMPCIVVRTRQNRSIAFGEADLVLPDLDTLAHLIRSAPAS